MDTTSNIQVAQPPFNNIKKADVILISSDAVQFYTHKLVLSLASDIFQDMFALPQPECAIEFKLDTAVLTENSLTLDALLRLCYPVKDPAIQELSFAADVLEAAIKYQMEEAINLMKDYLLKSCSSKPLEVFGIACRNSISDEELAKSAANEWMWRRNIWHTSDAIKTVPMIKPRSGKAGKSPLSEKNNDCSYTFSKWENTSIGETYSQQYMEHCTAGQFYRLLQGIRTRSLPTNILVTASEAKPNDKRPSLPFPAAPDSATSRVSCDEITLRSIDGVDFRVRKLILQLASETFFTILEADSLIQNDNLDPASSSIPHFNFPYHSSIIQKLLEICDPSSSAMELGQADDMHHLLRMGVKYNIPKVISFVKMWWKNLVTADPVESYFTAVQCGWEEQAREAARGTVYSSIEDAYTSEMEYVSARSYYNLMKYHHQCQRGVNDVLNEYHAPPLGSPSMHRMLFSIWQTLYNYEPSVKARWNEETIATLISVSRIHDDSYNFTIDSLPADLKSIKRELERRINAIQLEFTIQGFVSRQS